ncbi:hypothetical protein, partial [Leptospira broomii]|uniref:hypothetical protein n=1 Tax=Leptospira broomii TaxID=301541 RepID=UPI00059475CB
PQNCGQNGAEGVAPTRRSVQGVGQGGGFPSPASDSVGFQTVRIYARLNRQIGVRWVVQKANELKARRNERSEWRTP